MHTQINNEVFKEFPILESKKLIFREFEASDAANLFAIRSNPEAMKYMDTYLCADMIEANQMIEKNRKSFYNQSGINWVIASKASGKMLGYFSLWRIIKEHCRGEIGIALIPEHWGNGYMQAAFKTIIPFLFNKLHLHSIEANIDKRNDASRHLLEKFNFKQEAHFKENYLFNNQYYDSVIFSLLEDEFPIEP